MLPPRATRVVVDEAEARNAAAHAQDEVAADVLGRRQCQDAVRVGVVAERGREGDLGAGAREVDRGVERVAAAADAEASVVAARELDHDVADRDHAGALARLSLRLAGPFVLLVCHARHNGPRREPFQFEPWQFEPWQFGQPVSRAAVRPCARRDIAA
jgi:hypothetical protein